MAEEEAPKVLVSSPEEAAIASSDTAMRMDDPHSSALSSQLATGGQDPDLQPAGNQLGALSTHLGHKNLPKILVILVASFVVMLQSAINHARDGMWHLPGLDADACDL